MHWNIADVSIKYVIYYLKKCSIIYYRNMEIIMENVQA